MAVWRTKLKLSGEPQEARLLQEHLKTHREEKSKNTINAIWNHTMQVLWVNSWKANPVAVCGAAIHSSGDLHDPHETGLSLPGLTVFKVASLE